MLFSRKTLVPFLITSIFIVLSGCDNKSVSSYGTSTGNAIAQIEFSPLQLSNTENPNAVNVDASRSAARDGSFDIVESPQEEGSDSDALSVDVCVSGVRYVKLGKTLATAEGFPKLVNLGVYKVTVGEIELPFPGGEVIATIGPDCGTEFSLRLNGPIPLTTSTSFDVRKSIPQFGDSITLPASAIDKAKEVLQNGSSEIQVTPFSRTVTSLEGTYDSLLFNEGIQINAPGIEELTVTQISLDGTSGGTLNVSNTGRVQAGILAGGIGAGYVDGIYEFCDASQPEVCSRARVTVAFTPSGECSGGIPYEIGSASVCLTLGTTGSSCESTCQSAGLTDSLLLYSSQREEAISLCNNAATALANALGFGGTPSADFEGGLACARRGALLGGLRTATTTNPTEMSQKSQNLSSRICACQ